MSGNEDVERRVQSVIAGNRMAGIELSVQTVERVRAIAAGEMTVDEAVAATIAAARQRQRP